MSEDEAATVDVFRALLGGTSTRRAAAAMLLLHLVADDAADDGEDEPGTVQKAPEPA